MTTINLDDELSAGPEEAKRTVEAENTEATESLSKLLEANALKSANRDVSPKVVNLVKRAVGIMDDGPQGAAKAAKLIHKALQIDDEFALANQAMALCLERLGRLSAALAFYEKAWKQNPADPEIYMNLGMVAWKLDMLEAAEKFLRLFLQMSPGHVLGLMNFAGLMRDQARFDDSVEILRNAIYANPERYELWNGLGATLLEAGDPEQALTFFNEALRLEGKFGRAHHNIAYAYELLGKPELAEPHFASALDRVSARKDEIAMRYGQAQATLSLGRLEEGWERYQARLHPEFPNAVQFLIKAPMWDGVDLDAIKGKRVLWIGEQGLGDEVLFLQMARDLYEAIGPDGELFIAVEKRLMGIAKSIAPFATIGHHATVRSEALNRRVVRDFDEDQTWDFWTPLAQPTRSLRLSVEAFSPAGYYTPKAEDIRHWTQVLSEISDLPKVGILWKSLKMDAKRSKHFAPFDRWKSLLTQDGLSFINLQYGESDEEIAYAAREWGVTIHTLPNLNLKDDLEEVSALCCALDLTVGPTNATTNLAGAAGANVWTFSPVHRVWPQLGTDYMPWFPNTRMFGEEGYANWTGTMKTLSQALEEFRTKTKAA